MFGEQAKIVCRYYDDLTPSQKLQLRGLCNTALKEAQNKRRLFTSLQMCSGVDGPLQEIQTDIRVMMKLVKLFSAMAA